MYRKIITIDLNDQEESMEREHTYIKRRRRRKEKKWHLRKLFILSFSLLVILYLIFVNITVITKFDKFHNFEHNLKVKVKNISSMKSYNSQQYNNNINNINTINNINKYFDYDNDLNELDDDDDDDDEYCNNHPLDISYKCLQLILDNVYNKRARNANYRSEKGYFHHFDDLFSKKYIDNHYDTYFYDDVIVLNRNFTSFRYAFSNNSNNNNNNNNKKNNNKNDIFLPEIVDGKKIHYFFHVHKGAGSTICQLAKENQKKIYNNQHENCNMPVNIRLKNNEKHCLTCPYLGNTITEQIKNYNHLYYEEKIYFVMNEGKMERNMIINGPWSYSIFIRNPITRFQSNFFFSFLVAQKQQQQLQKEPKPKQKQKQKQKQKKRNHVKQKQKQQKKNRLKQKQHQDYSTKQNDFESNSLAARLQSSKRKERLFAEFYFKLLIEGIEKQKKYDDSSINSKDQEERILTTGYMMPNYYTNFICGYVVDDLKESSKRRKNISPLSSRDMLECAAERISKFNLILILEKEKQFSYFANFYQWPINTVKNEKSFKKREPFKKKVLEIIEEMKRENSTLQEIEYKFHYLDLLLYKFAKRINEKHINHYFNNNENNNENRRGNTEIDNNKNKDNFFDMEADYLLSGKHDVRNDDIIEINTSNTRYVFYLFFFFFFF